MSEPLSDDRRADPRSGPGPSDGDDWDVTWIVSTARQQDPGLQPETAELLAGQARHLLVEIGELDAPALARALMAANSHVGASAANVVATASVAYCTHKGTLG